MGGHENLEPWTCERAEELYGIRSWGGGYFDISDDGEVVVRLGHDDRTASLMDIIGGIKERGFSLPVLLRFTDLLDSRMALLNETFRAAMAEAGYRGMYRGVYPIKVNQQQEVVEEVASFGKRYHHGLEAGSKAELIAALSCMDDPEAFVVCNGYKDEEFIDLALYGLKMGVQTILVVETPGELALILKEAARLRVRPRLGARVKLSTRAGGRWTESGGDRSVFGLNAAQLIDVVDKLREQNMQDCLQMLHYHLGSQIPDIADVRASVAEAVRYYIDLVREGAAMGILDIGGGLAVDYDGSHSNAASSRNYDLPEYCADVVDAIVEATDRAGVEHPTLISESGRALISYHSLLLVNVLGVSRLDSHGLPPSLPDGAPEFLHRLLEVLRDVTPKHVQESYHDALYYRQQLRADFLHGRISLRQRALAEQLFWQVAMRVAAVLEKAEYVPDELQGLASELSDIYYCNFSLFQSLPDSWAIDHLFPVMPIHRLGERPSRMGTVADITCDCDGKIDKFISLREVKRALPMHELREDEDYVLGIFMIGAYQETLGDLHNLFGDTNVVSVKLGEDGRLEYACETQGDSVADVLSYVEYEPKALMGRFRRLAERAVHTGSITPSERREILDAYEAGLRGYTYFET